MSANYEADKETGGGADQLGGTTYERLAKLFVYADTDGSGTLSVSELTSIMDKKKTKKFLKQIGLNDLCDFFADFASGDRDGSSQLDFEEFVAYVEKKNGKLKIDGKPTSIGTAADALLRDVYDAIDSGRYSKNSDKAGDGISKAEFKRAFKTSKKLQKMLIKLGAADTKYDIELFQSFKCEDADDDDVLSFPEFKIYLQGLKNYDYQSGASG